MEQVITAIVVNPMHRLVVVAICLASLAIRASGAKATDGKDIFIAGGAMLAGLALYYFPFALHVIHAFQDGWAACLFYAGALACLAIGIPAPGSRGKFVYDAAGVAHRKRRGSYDHTVFDLESTAQRFTIWSLKVGRIYKYVVVPPACWVGSVLAVKYDPALTVLPMITGPLCVFSLYGLVRFTYLQWVRLYYMPIPDYHAPRALVVLSTPTNTPDFEEKPL